MLLWCRFPFGKKLTFCFTFLFCHSASALFFPRVAHHVAAATSLWWNSRICTAVRAAARCDDGRSAHFSPVGDQQQYGAAARQWHSRVGQIRHDRRHHLAHSHRAQAGDPIRLHSQASDPGPSRHHRGRRIFLLRSRPSADHTGCIAISLRC